MPQAEEARTRGTQVTVESFSVWKAQFDKEMAAKKLKEEEERLKGLSAKEREEHKRALTRITGKIYPVLHGDAFSDPSKAASCSSATRT
jgi:hypothetical protein